jgi:hypothetical protein
MYEKDQSDPTPPPVRANAPPTVGGPLMRPHKSTDGKDAYNIVSDTVIGVNVRWRDNLFQAIAILVITITGAVVGVGVADDPLAGVIVGGIGGLIAGTLISGVALMIYRAARHARGKHV